MSKRWTTALLAAWAGTVAISAAGAHADTGAVVATWHVAPGSYDMSAGMGAVWAINIDEFHRGVLYRIDPATNEISTVTTVSFPPGGITAAYGSIWVADYYGNAVWRIAPDGHVQATIHTGLQPQWTTAAFGSLWTSNHHGGSLTRVDPTTDTVVATVPVGRQHTFRDGPQALTHDATHVYVSSSNLFKLQAVDPTDNSVSTPAGRPGDDQLCGELRSIDGWVWSLDRCSPGLYQLGKDGTVHAVIDGGTAYQLSETVLAGALWVSEDRDPDTSSSGALVQHDPRTGAALRTVPIGGDASTVRAGFGDLWVFDANRYTIRRVHV
jgi:streptogramin lyase